MAIFSPFVHDVIMRLIRMDANKKIKNDKRIGNSRDKTFMMN